MYKGAFYLLFLITTLQITVRIQQMHSNLKPDSDSGTLTLNNKSEVKHRTFKILMSEANWSILMLTNWVVKSLYLVFVLYL